MQSTLVAMAMDPLRKKERAKVLPEVSVSSLTEALNAFFWDVKSRDLYSKVKPWFSTKWKHAPVAKTMAESSVLFKYLFSTGLAKNGMLPNSMLTTAFSKMVSGLSMEKPRGATDDLWMDRMNQTIRALASQWRDLRASKEAECRCLRRASPQEIELVKATLAVMEVPKKQNMPNNSECRPLEHWDSLASSPAHDWNHGEDLEYFGHPPPPKDTCQRSAN